MMTLKESIDSDIDEVFLDVDEFADPHVINGRRLKCVIDTIVTQGGTDAGHLGVFLNQIRVHMREGLIKTPVEGQQIRVDGVRYVVRSVSREMGMIVFTAERNSQ